MENRIIKFRGNRVDNGEWVYGSLINTMSAIPYIMPEQKVIATGRAFNLLAVEVIPETVGQFTGHQIGGVNLYESDIVRLEENEDGVDPEDRMIYYVVTWISEWCMFALLRVEDEYQEYLNEGTESLDTASFWTFPLDVEDIGNSNHYLCGNIYENKNLLNNGQ